MKAILVEGHKVPNVMSNIDKKVRTECTKGAMQ